MKSIKFWMPISALVLSCYLSLGAKCSCCGSDEMQFSYVTNDPSNPVVYTGTMECAKAYFNCGGGEIVCAEAYIVGYEYNPVYRVPARDIFSDN